MFEILKPVFRYEIRRQLSVYFESQQTVIQSTHMAEFSFGFTERSFLQSDGQKHLRSVAEHLINNKQKEPNEFIKNGEETDIITLSSRYFPTGHKFA